MLDTSQEKMELVEYGTVCSGKIIQLVSYMKGLPYKDHFPLVLKHELWTFITGFKSQICHLLVW